MGRAAGLGTQQASTPFFLLPPPLPFIRYPLQVQRDCPSALSWDVVGRIIARMPLLAIGCAALLVLLDASFRSLRLRSCCPDPAESAL